MQENIDYNFVERLESELYSIKILTGDFADVVYTYGKVSIKEENGQGILSYDFRIEESNELLESELNSSEKFKNTLGDILVSILENQEFGIGGLEPEAKDITIEV